MDRLTLVKRLALEAGASGVVVSTIGLSGESLRLVTWIDQAWEDIQRMNPQWKWMRKTAGPANIIQDQAAYAPTDAPFSLTDFGEWLNETARIFKGTVDNEQILTQYPYERFRDTFIYGTTRSTSGYPVALTITPLKELQVALRPDDTDYFLSMEYYKKPTPLTADTDEPDMPERYHIMIVWKALMYYGGYESSPEAFSRASQSFLELKDDLTQNQGKELLVDRSFL